MNARLASIDNVCGVEGWKILEPEARPLRLAMAELPRLHTLRRLLIIDDPLLSVAVHDRILDTDAFNRRIPKCREEFSPFI